MSHESSSREREPEKESRGGIFPPKAGQAAGPVMIEREVRAVCRNAQELLDFHERFVDALRCAVSATGFQDALSPTGEGWLGKGGGDEMVTGEIERAIAMVVEKFVHEVSVPSQLLFPFAFAHVADRLAVLADRARRSAYTSGIAPGTLLRWTWCAARRTGGRWCGRRMSSDAR